MCCDARLEVTTQSDLSSDTEIRSTCQLMKCMLTITLTLSYLQIRDVEEAFHSLTNCRNVHRITTLRHLAGTEFTRLEYVPGDPFKNINWKAFARTGDLMIN